MRTFAHSIILAIALTSPAQAWGERPPAGDTPLNRVATALAARRFVSSNCDGIDSTRWATDRLAASYGIDQAAQHSPEIENHVRLWSLFLIKNKDRACDWIWNAYGPDGTRAPGVVFANPGKRTPPLPF